MEIKNIPKYIKKEWRVETYLWSTVIILLISGIASIFIGRSSGGDMGEALVGIGLALIIGSLAGSFSGRILGWPFGWIFGVLISLIFTPIFANYLADSVASLSASISGPVTGLVVGLWAEKRDKEEIIDNVKEV